MALDSDGHKVVTTSIVMVVITVLSSILRHFSRHQLGKGFDATEYLMFVALLTFIAYTGVLIAGE